MSAPLKVRVLLNGEPERPMGELWINEGALHHIDWTGWRFDTVVDGRTRELKGVDMRPIAYAPAVKVTPEMRLNGLLGHIDGLLKPMECNHAGSEFGACFDCRNTGYALTCQEEVDLVDALIAARGAARKMLDPQPAPPPPTPDEEF